MVTLHSVTNSQTNSTHPYQQNVEPLIDGVSLPFPTNRDSNLTIEYLSLYQASHKTPVQILAKKFVATELEMGILTSCSYTMLSSVSLDPRFPTRDEFKGALELPINKTGIGQVLDHAPTLSQLAATIFVASQYYQIDIKKINCIEFASTSQRAKDASSNQLKAALMRMEAIQPSLREFLIVHYDKTLLGAPSPGGKNVSLVGGYLPEKDLVLLMNQTREESLPYGCIWVPFDDLMQAMVKEEVFETDQICGFISLICPNVHS